MASEHEWRDCFHPTTQQGGDGCHFFMRCHGIWPERCDLSERDHRESDAEKIERLMGSDGSIGLVGPLQATRMLMNGRAVLVRTEQWERQFRPVDSYACQECGRSDGLDAVVPDGVWAEISHGQNLLCLWCIDRRCEEAGIGVAATLHFMGRAITGTSQSDADADHNARLTALLAERDAEVARLCEAATALTAKSPCFVTIRPGGDDIECCQFCLTDNGHDLRCEWVRLVAALAARGREGQG